MPTMELSSGFVTSYIPSVWSGAISGTLYYNRSFVLGYTSQAGYEYYFKIMQGIMPTDFSTLTSTSSRSSDLLINYTAGFISPQEVTAIPSSNSSTPCTLSTIFKNASASGTATWFWSLATVGTNLLQQFIGTVGLVGSGADLEIDSVNIVSGSAYKVSNLKVLIPTSWTY